MYILLASVVGSPHLLTLLAHLVRYTHVYLACKKPSVQPVANRRLFFDLQVVTLLLGEYTLFARADLYYPTTRLRS